MQGHGSGDLYMSLRATSLVFQLLLVVEGAIIDERLRHEGLGSVHGRRHNITWSEGHVPEDGLFFLKMGSAWVHQGCWALEFEPISCT